MEILIPYIKSRWCMSSKNRYDSIERLVGVARRDDMIAALAYAADGDLLALGERDGAVRRWEMGQYPPESPAPRARGGLRLADVPRESARGPEGSRAPPRSGNLVGSSRHTVRIARVLRD